MAEDRLAEKVAVVTGGGSGIGRAICARFAEEDAIVAVLDVSQQQAEQTSKLIQDRRGHAVPYVCDVSSQHQVRQAVDRIVEEHGRIDILVNNAGVAHIGKLEDTTEADMDRIYAVNVKGVYNGMHAAVGRMLEQGGGVILNLSSIAANAGVADRFAYSMSKGAVQTMTFSVARDYIDRGIRCNCICPARVHTPFVDNYLKRHYAGQEQQMFEKLSAYQPIGRMARPEEIAAFAAYLCSNEAAFITGNSYDIDGGVMRLR